MSWSVLRWRAVYSLVKPRRDPDNGPVMEPAPAQEPGNGGACFRGKGNNMNEQKEREQRIRERAYQIWLSEGQPEGREKENWHEAEKQILEQESGQASPLPGPYENIG